MPGRLGSRALASGCHNNLRTTPLSGRLSTRYQTSGHLTRPGTLHLADVLERNCWYTDIAISHTVDQVHRMWYTQNGAQLWTLVGKEM